MMKKTFTHWAALALAALFAAACSSDGDNLAAGISTDSTVQTPIRITANYGADIVGSRAAAPRRINYSESGTEISAKWQADDQLYVCYNGHVNTLTLTSGAGTETATFEGTVTGTPSSTSVLICYVRDAQYPAAITVSSTGEYSYSADAFLTQDGSLASAAARNVYYGVATYGTGEGISCNFSVNTAMLKLTVVAPDGISEGDAATLTYTSGGTALARASFTVGSSTRNIVYLTVPAGSQSGEQALVYASGSTEKAETLSATKATFKAGETYSKSINFGTTEIVYSTSDFNNSQSINPVMILQSDLPLQKITRANGTINLNGHTTGFYMQNNVAGESITITNGTITEFDGNSGWSDWYKGTIILENVNVTCEIFTDGHRMEINSGTFSRNIQNYKSGSVPGIVIIRGGSFAGNFNTESLAAHGDYTIYGGKFKVNPSNIRNATIPAGYSVKSNTGDDKDTYPYIVSAD